MILGALWGFVAWFAIYMTAKAVMIFTDGSRPALSGHTVLVILGFMACGALLA